MSDDPREATEVATPSVPPIRKRSLLKWVLVALGGLLLVVAVGIFGLVQTSKSRAKRTYPVAEVSIIVPTDAAALAEGERLAQARGCTDCHGAALVGRVFLEDPALGVYAGPNLTPASRVAQWSDGDIARLVRRGVRPDGTPAIFMPAHEYQRMPDAELGPIIAYIRSVPASDNDPGRCRFGLIGRVLHVTGGMPMLPAEIIDHQAPPSHDVDTSDPVAFGSYIADSCTGCHGVGLSGGKIPGTPPSIPIPANITPHETGLAGWTRDQFASAVRQGTRPDGTPLDPFMPFNNYSALTDHEIDSLWAYLQTVPAKEFGGR